jgi:4-diphosphocytidyl-2-C-methyl-D-erythritol kinase
MPEPLTGLAPAKVNLVLEVTDRRPDGYHEVDTILQTLELADRVTLEQGARPGVRVEGPFAAGTPVDATNLASRAAEALAARLGRDASRLSIGLEKNIPPAGGLGGGASDAATTLRLLQHRWAEATESDLLAVANKVGSDEAFFLVAGTARARGRGECVTRLPALPRHGVVLFIPRATLERKTARLFAALDALPFDAGGVAETFARTAPAAFTSAGVFNAFERVAFDVFPGLATLWERLEARLGEPVHLAGAGPSLFWIGPADAAAAIAARAAGEPCTVIETATAGPAWNPS